ncbi:hypothetical protein BDM02DRAFT_2323748 [Thelephora ganbajun]|uniref:Uncharacterized protein n=1 Tax=Thelephora ganbajun TaxID=370292 RepID=A0ACB6ZEY7_THEGA|nr:hypothetical protein BDM02DRAFT_2323748 [Thelephora ganbajun]
MTSFLKASPLSLHPKERSMYVPIISIKRLDRRKGGGDSGKGGGGVKSKPSEGGPDNGKGLKVSNADADSLPQGHNNATTHGEGIDTPVEVESVRFDGSHVADGTGHHPNVPNLSVIPSEHLSDVTHPEVHDSVGDYPNPDCRGLPQNNPGDGLVGITMAPNASDSTSFFFISNSYSATEVQRAVQENCSDATVSDLVPFDSTDDLQLGTLVQFYHGDCAAILLRGYDSAKETPGSPNFLPNPPFQSSALECLYYTIGESMTLMKTVPGLTPSTAALWGPSPFPSLRMIS